MIVDLTRAQADAVAVFLSSRLGDLSGEIAATDNPAYRRDLIERRRLLREVLDVLTRSATSEAPA